MTEQQPATGTYDWFVAEAERLLSPLVQLLHEGASIIPIDGPASDHGVMADELESVARPMLLAALWLRADRDGCSAESEPTVDADAMAAWFRQAITLGTDPTSTGYWGNLSNHHQHAVEMAIIVMAIDIAR
ncbi:MAG: DUF2264 domain-containing protein, partial [Planctomycetota bacterium]